jgi:hypothetical protein
MRVGDLCEGIMAVLHSTIEACPVPVLGRRSGPKGRDRRGCCAALSPSMAVEGA